MTNMKRFLTILLLFAGFSAYSQSKVKVDLYLFFESDSNTLKFERKQTPTYLNGQYFPDGYDIYAVKTISDDKKKMILTLLFATINKDRYRVTDSIELKTKKVIPFKNVFQLKGIRNDTSDKKNFPYAKVFIVEKLSANQFKIIQVHSYIGSDVVSSGPID